jgi:hypothetical protein
MEGYAYFPAIVYRDERPDFVKKALPAAMKHLDKVRNSMWAMLQSEHVGNDPDMRELSDYLLWSSVDILRTQGYDVEKYDFYFQCLWAQELQKGAGTNIHVHKNSQICGWFFLETPENGAYPIYHDTRANKQMIELDYIQGNEITNATGLINFKTVRPGTVLFSNSWVQHQLIGGNSEVPTRCIHFVVSHKERACSTC